MNDFPYPVYKDSSKCPTYIPVHRQFAFRDNEKNTHVRNKLSLAHRALEEDESKIGSNVHAWAKLVLENLESSCETKKIICN